MISKFFLQAGPRLAVTVIFLSAPIGARAEKGGNLGSVSTCPHAPEISSAAISYVLSPQSGLTLSQADAAILTIVRQACISSPNFAPRIAAQAVVAASRAALSAGRRSAALPNKTSLQSALSSPAAIGVSATAGYAEILQSILRGAILGCASTGMTTTDLKNILSAVCSAVVLESAKQAGSTAALSHDGPLPADKSLPMDNAENAIAVIKEIVGTFAKTAASLGIPEVEIAGSINLAGQDAMETAKHITAGTLATEISEQAVSQTAGQTAIEVALQVARKVAKEVAAQIAAQVYQSVLGIQNADNQTQGQSTDGSTPSTPGMVRPGLFPNPPVPSPTPFPSPPPTPVPTPKPPSPR